jgi:hypothetical protein
MLAECNEIVLLGQRVDMLKDTLRCDDKTTALENTEVERRTYPYFPLNSRVFTLYMKLKADGSPYTLINKVSNISNLVDPTWLGAQIQKLLEENGVNYKRKVDYAVMVHSGVTVLDRFGDELKLQYDDKAGKNCCGALYKVKAPLTGDVVIKVGRVCGVLEVTYVDQYAIQQSLYKVVLSCLIQSDMSTQQLSYPLYRQECIDISGNYVAQCRLVKPSSICGGVGLIPYLRTDEVFSSSQDALSTQFYAVFTEDFQYGAYDHTQKKTIDFYLNHPYNIVPDFRKPCFLSEEFLRYEQQELGLNETKLRGH